MLTFLQAIQEVSYLDKEKYIELEISKTSNVLKRKCKNSELNRKIDEATGKNGWIIGFIADNQDRDIFQRDIEEMFSIRRSTVSSMLQLMEKKGLIIRESVGYDARLKKLTLTPRAWEIHNQMIENLKENEKKLSTGLSDEEISVFFSVLDRIRSNAEEEVEK